MEVSEQVSVLKDSLNEKAIAELSARIEHFSPAPASIPAKNAKERLERLKLMLECLKDLREINKDQGY